MNKEQIDLEQHQNNLKKWKTGIEMKKSNG